MVDLNQTLFSKSAPKEPQALSGSEVDRYGSHFGPGKDGLDQLKKMTETKGTGAEQERYHSHFGLDEEKIKAAAATLMDQKGSGAEQDVHAAHFGLGNDGMQQVKKLAKSQGVGAEQVCHTDDTFCRSTLILIQDRYGSHFGVDEDTIAAAKDRIHDSISRNEGAEHMG
jgi:hypothetical protein